MAQPGDKPGVKGRVSDARLEEIAELQEMGMAHYATLEALELYAIVEELCAAIRARSGRYRTAGSE